MKIGELARRTGVSERSLRYYEQQGLLTADRTPGGHRDYPERAVDRVIRIQELFAAGLHSRKIASLLPCLRDTDGGPAETATPRLVEELTAERARIDRLIAGLHTTREVLDEVIDAASEPRDEPHVQASMTCTSRAPGSSVPATDSSAAGKPASRKASAASSSDS
ncbi:DNA-binding transcriptional MerR regulator [Amycolatopsis bartoniae]|nr:MerR family transcriptional regulator [Amycolatopsis bartoniae]MBB2937558.1 DNA-binding transcriptional MerR regulator [Amycolatopsis bartoniae]TVT05931.1 MerR family transcriptional regulator [Amycolatopsis bartoniae]